MIQQKGVALNAYRLLFFLTLLNLLNFVDRQLIASFANFIVPDLGLTDTQYGFLTTVPFIVFYSIAGLFMGVLADMVNRPKLIAFGVVLWSVFTALTGAAKGFISMALPRMFIGVGESILTPTSMSLLSDSFPSKRMGFAAGFYYMGVPIGVGVSLLIAGYLGESLGWRNCFFVEETFEPHPVLMLVRVFWIGCPFIGLHFHFTKAVGNISRPQPLFHVLECDLGYVYASVQI